MPLLPGCRIRTAAPQQRHLAELFGQSDSLRDDERLPALSSGRMNGFAPGLPVVRPTLSACRPAPAKGRGVRGQRERPRPNYPTNPYRSA